MIELAPTHKIGLPVQNPILLGAGAVGDGESIPAVLRESGIGAVVIGPLTLSPRRGSAPPRLFEYTGGFTLNTMHQNRGVRGTIKRCIKSWERMPCPIILQLADNDADDILRAAERLESTGSVDGFEVLVDENADSRTICGLLRAIVSGTDLPVLAKLPFGFSASLVEEAVEVGIASLVVAQPPHGVAPASIHQDSVREFEPERGIVQGRSYTSGHLHGPAALPMMLHALSTVVDMQLDVPLIMSGGVHCFGDVQAALAAGASAIQLDGAVWVEPGLAGRLVSEWSALKS